MAQWFHPSMQRAWAQSLVGELGSHMPCGQKKGEKNVPSIEFLEDSWKSWVLGLCLSLMKHITLGKNFSVIPRICLALLCECESSVSGIDEYV